MYHDRTLMQIAWQLLHLFPCPSTGIANASTKLGPHLNRTGGFR